MKRFSLVITLFLTCGIAFGILVLLDSLFNKRETKTNRFAHFYSIEPETLLGELRAGKVDMFSPIAEEPPFLPVDQQIPVPWTQEDYLHITNALFDIVWNDTLNDWQLNSMSFALGCTKSDIGFQDGSFRFFKIQEVNENKTRFERIINIDPRNKYIYVTENVYYPKLVDWSSIDLENNQLSANEILQIAEDMGGKAKRQSVKNACDISILLSPDSASYRGWWVHYSRRDDRNTLFRVDIDPSTGDVHIP